MTVPPIPEGYHTVTPWIIGRETAGLMEFLAAAFGAEDLGGRVVDERGRIGPAEMRIGDSVVMLGDARPEHPAMQAMLYLYVDDVDATYQIALSSGATAVQPPQDHFYGDRSGGVKDPCGNVWYIATHIEDVSPVELKRRAQQAMQGGH